VTYTRDLDGFAVVAEEKRKAGDYSGFHVCGFPRVQISGDRQAFLFMLVNLWRFFLAIAILAKLHIHRLSISDNLYLPGTPPPKRFEPIGYLIRLEFG
jgi:hypothetical protein